jgi:hypothetical protein
VWAEHAWDLTSQNKQCGHGLLTWHKELVEFWDTCDSFQWRELRGRKLVLEQHYVLDEMLLRQKLLLTVRCPPHTLENFNWIIMYIKDVVDDESGPAHFGNGTNP